MEPSLHFDTVLHTAACTEETCSLISFGLIPNTITFLNECSNSYLPGIKVIFYQSTFHQFFNNKIWTLSKSKTRSQMKRQKYCRRRVLSRAHEEKHKSLDYVNKLSSLNLFIYWIITRGA